MTSVVNTSVKFIHSRMANAPVLNGTAGSLVALLDAFLQDGFDSKTATSLVVTGGVATLTFSGTHSGEIDSVIVVSGSSITALNGEQKITAKGANTLSFATAASNGTATGTITFKMAPLGWTIAFTGTNLRAYKATDVSASGFLVRVDDTPTDHARVRGYTSMSDINTGLGRFPSEAQFAGGLYWPKSYSASSSPVEYFLIGDGALFYLHNSAYTYAQPSYLIGPIQGFGDMIPYRDAGDPWTCSIGGHNISGFQSYGNRGSFMGNEEGIWCARNYTGLSESWQAKSWPFVGSESAISGSDPRLGPFPSRVDGALRLSRRYLRSYDDSQKEPRCEVPGLLHVPQEGVYVQLPQFSVQAGTGALAGRKLMSISVGQSYTSPPESSGGCAMADITGPWR